MLPYLARTPRQQERQVRATTADVEEPHDGVALAQRLQCRREQRHHVIDLEVLANLARWERAVVTQQAERTQEHGAFGGPDDRLLVTEELGRALGRPVRLRAFRDALGPAGVRHAARLRQAQG